MEITNELIPVGSGICPKCRMWLDKLQTEELEKSKVEVTEYIEEMTTNMESLKLTRVTPDSPITPKCRRESVYVPSREEEEELDESVEASKCDNDDNDDDDDEPRRQLNGFLQLRDISPIRVSLSVPWNKAHERTKRRYVRKAKQCISAVLDVLTPEDSISLWRALYENNNVGKDEEEITPKGDKELELLEAYAESYAIAQHWSTRRQILSMMADKITFKELKQHIPMLTRYRYNIARRHRLLHGRAAPLPSWENKRMRIDPSQLEHFVSFITSPHAIQDVPFGERLLKLSTGEIVKTPNVIRTMIPERVVQQYEQYCKETAFKPMSKRTLQRVLTVCSASTRTSLQGLDNFSAQGSDAFDELDSLVDKLIDCGKTQIWGRDIKQQLRSSQQYLKGDYKLHVAESSTISDHCRVYALSDPNDADFKGDCDHLHLDSCAQCSQLKNVFRILENECATTSCSDEEEKSDMVYVLQRAKDAILSWKAHLLRSVHQDEAKHSVLNKLDNKSVLLVPDWAMKYIPRKFREAQSDWFAKRGLPWHITVAVRKSQDNKHLESTTIVHVFQSCTQDSSTVSGIMVDCLRLLKKEMPYLEKAYYKQDNAGCYHSGNSIVSAKLAGDLAGVTIIRNDFSDPQGGKGACDRQAATIKGAIGRYVNQGHDVNNALQLKTGIESGQGLTGVKATYVAATTASTLSLKWDGISLLNNFEYEMNGIRVWRAFNVGPGRLVPWDTFGVSTEKLGALETLNSTSLASNPAFRVVRHRYTKKTSNAIQFGENEGQGEKEEVEEEEKEEEYEEEEEEEEEELDDDDDDDDNDEAMLFTCPEEGCIKAYSRFSSLQNHLDTGRHKRMPEHETLYDKAIKEYAFKLTEGATRVPDVQCEAVGGKEDLTALLMGWALKSAKKKKRFTSKQTAFLTEQFQIGGVSGRKVDPQEVSKAMAVTRRTDGARLFPPDEVLTKQQISGFFSRLSAKKRLNCPVVMENDDEDIYAAETETQFSTLCANVMMAVQLNHPIICFDFNICEMVQKNKLSKLCVEELRNVCIELGEDVEDLSQRRKKPYIERINNIVKNCCPCTA